MAEGPGIRVTRLAHPPVKIGIYASMRHHNQYLGYFAEGLRAHGIDVSVQRVDDYQPCDLAVMWGHKFDLVIDAQHSCGGDYLVMECGYLGDRLENLSLGFNGLNGHATFIHPEAPDSSRGEQFYHLIQEPSDRAEYYLICGQVLGDASLAGVDYPRLVYNLPRQFNGLPVYFRPHPLDRGYQITDHEICPHQPLNEALRRAAQVWIYNSNSGVDAILAGTPVAAFDRGAMCWNYSTHCVMDPPQLGDREAMVNELAWCQWHIEEIRNGTAWECLKQRYV